MSYIGNIPTTAAFPFDQFSGTGSQTAFTLTYAPAGTTSILVSVSGVMQNPNTYGVIGTTLTFTGAPPSGTSNIAVLYLGLPVIGVSSPGNTAYRTPQDFTATASQTTFATAGAYTVGFVDVYRNGSRLGTADFTATNGTTVVLANACTAGDLVTIIYFTLTSIVNALPQGGGTITGSLAVAGNFTLTGNASGVLKSSTAVASTSGTSIDFTGIPATAKRVTVMFSGVSTSGTSIPLVQLGDSGGIEITGYLGTGGNVSGNVYALQTTGFGISGSHAAAQVTHGQIIISLVDANSWVCTSLLYRSDATGMLSGGGSKTLSGTLDRLRITTVNGTDTFDAGTINIMYE